ncbi:MAG TPA: hypothetical protein VFH08_17005 [Chitinophagaceae bacterium]|nr:hypothetical protein [Chitinophagaceae bacterium]
MSKKIIIIFLGALLLNGSTEIHQLWKLPFLVKHYLQHRNDDPLLSFTTFLKIHYTDRDHPDDNDDKDDNELPFKSIGNISHIDTPVLEKQIAATGNYCLPEKLTTYYPKGIPDNRSFSIFHPPRIA